jgi:hypothetical protein
LHELDGAVKQRDKRSDVSDALRMTGGLIAA